LAERSRSRRLRSAPVADPVSAGIVPNLAHPGGNITGFATQNVGLEGKRLELLKELVPQLSLWLFWETSLTRFSVQCCKTCALQPKRFMARSMCFLAA
jgi:hypothetical protein